MTSPTVVLIGPMGAGKTSVGRRVAKMLGVPFVDTDARIAHAHGPIPALFAERGEAAFRALERAAVEEALRGDGVVALGGGAVLDPHTRADLRHVPVVLLTVDARTVAGRIARSTRPLLQGGDAVTRWRQVADARAELYARTADVTFDTSTGRIRDIAVRVADWAREHRADGTADPQHTQEGTA